MNLLVKESLNRIHEILRVHYTEEEFCSKLHCCVSVFWWPEIARWRQELPWADDEGWLRRRLEWLKWNWVNDGCERS